MVLDPVTRIERASPASGGAGRLRTQAEAIHRHGFTNFFAHTFTGRKESN